MDGASDHANDIAHAVLVAFGKLPSKCKPRKAATTNAPGVREWVPLAGIVVEDGDVETTTLECVALATGMKCTPDARLESARGAILHDGHAEVLVLRALNRLLLEQCALVHQGGQTGQSSGNDLGKMLVERNPDTGSSSRPFRLRSSIRLAMYCSECPCGDASMELVMSRQSDGGAPWPSAQPDGPPPSGGPVRQTMLLGRGHFDRLGIVRRKPARPDAPLALSKSCSDKLALKQGTSLLSAVTSLFVARDENAYLHSLVLPTSDLVPEAIARAFSLSGRLAAVARAKQGDYTVRPFKVLETSRSFDFARQAHDAMEASPTPSNIACVSYGKTIEVIINGVLQGRKQSDLRGASSLSRRGMWSLARSLIASLNDPLTRKALAGESYSQVKAAKALEQRAAMKEHMIRGSLCPWPRTNFDRGWGLSK